MMNLHTQHISAGDRRLFVECRGDAEPAVFLEAGVGEASDTWQPIVADVAALARVCCYDRAGLGASDPATPPRTLLDLVRDLKAVITFVGAAPPYVLVGSSFGGLIAYHYAQRYPADVGGLVLLDAVHPRQMQAFADALAAYERAGNPIPPGLEHLRDASAHTDPADHPEQIDFSASLASIRAGGSLPDIPLAVLSRGTSFHEDMPELPAPIASLFDSVWRDLQRDLAQHTTKGTHIVVPGAGHNLHMDAPRQVIDAIGRIIAIVCGSESA